MAYLFDYKEEVANVEGDVAADFGVEDEVAHGVLGQHAFLTSLKFNAVFLFLFMLLFCMLLVCEIPMLALKFKNINWKENKQRYIFLLGCLPLLLLGVFSLAAIIIWYIAISVVLYKKYNTL